MDIKNIEDIEDQIAALRDVHDDKYEGYMGAEQCGRVADTMEKLLAVYRALIDDEHILLISDDLASAIKEVRNEQTTTT